MVAPPTPDTAENLLPVVIPPFMAFAGGVA